MTDGQALGTHNSYPLRDDPMVTEEWDYAMLPLDEQATREGVRQFELDVHQETDAQGATRFQVYQATGLDDASSCPTLWDCLTVLRTWSQAHPAHFPLLILIEPKDDAGGDPIDVDLLDQELLGVWPDPVTPAEVQGDHANLLDAVTAAGFPTLGTMRGRALFVLLDSSAHRDDYRTPAGADQGAGAGETNRPMFVNAASTEESDAAVLLMDDPTDTAIPAIVAAGFLVRTFIEPDLGAELSIRTGAHTLSSDTPAIYPLQGLPVACNPVHVNGECTPPDLENPAFMTFPVTSAR